MKNATKLLALTLAIIMLVSALPLGVFAIEDAPATTATTPANGTPYTGDYYHYYDFDNVTVGKINNSVSNPNGFVSDMRLDGTITAHEDGSGSYFAARYKNKSWRGWQIGVVDSNTFTDYSMVNGLEISFKMRWVGSGLVEDKNSMSLVGVRRARADNSSKWTDVILLIAIYDAATTDLVLKTQSSIAAQKDIEVARLKKGAAEFTEIKVDWHETTNSYSVYIDGVAKAEGVACVTDLRTSSYVVTTYDDDLIATRKAAEVAYDRKSIQLGRATPTDTTHQFHYDIDDLIIKEGSLYQNSFETIDSTGSTNSFKSDGTIVSTGVFNANNKSGAKNYTVSTETVNGVKNTYLSFAKGDRLDLKDYTYQFMQDGNWTVDFKIRATTSAKADFLRFHDKTSTPALLYTDAAGNIFIGNHQFPGVTMAKAESNNWTRITLSVIVDDVNKGVYDDYATCTRYARNYRIAVWVDGIYAGCGYYSRNESGADSGDTKNTIITDLSTIKTEITEADFLALTGIILVDDSNGIETYKAADGTLYQIKRNEDKSFASGMKIAFKTGSNYDVLGFFTKGTTLYGALDDLSVYRGIGPREYADSKQSTEGTVSELVFARMSTTSTHVMATNVDNNELGGFFMRGYRTISSNGFTRVEATATEPAYVRVVKNTDEEGTKSAMYLNAAYTGGKRFSVNLTLRNVSTPKTDIRVLNLTRQNEVGENKEVNTNAIYIEQGTSYAYYLLNGVKYYLCDESGIKYNFGTSDWKKLTVIYDETGSETLVTFLVNDELAYSYYKCGADTDNVGFSVPANSLSGVVSKDFYNLRNAIEQKVELYYTVDKAFSFELLTASVEYVDALDEVEAPVFDDTVAINFADFENIDEFKAKYGHQFIIDDGITIEDGILKVPSGKVFAWRDYNKTFLDFVDRNKVTDDNKYIHGFNVEAKAKVNKSYSGTSYLFKVYHGSCSNILIYLAGGYFHMTGSKNSGIKHATFASDQFDNVSATFTRSDNSTEATLFVNGVLAGVSRLSNPPKQSDEYVAFKFKDDAEYKEIYIHDTLERELAKQTGDILTFDLNAFLPAKNDRWPRNGVFFENRTNYGGGTINPEMGYSSIMSYTPEGSSTSVNFLRINGKDEKDTSKDVGKVVTGHSYTDIYLNKYIEDKTTVFEFDLRYIPVENPTYPVNPVELLSLRQTEEGYSTGLFSNFLYMTGEGYLTIYGEYTLCDMGGKEFVVSSEDFTNIAVIYDANSGKISYRAGGKVLYFKDSKNNVIGLANEIQLSNARYYRMDSPETRIRTFSISQNTDSNGKVINRFSGKVDVLGFKIYNIDGTANVGYVGAQPDTTSNNIRLVAGADMLYYGNVGFEIELFDENGKSLYGKKEVESTNTVYSSIIQNVNGDEVTVYPEDYGYRYFYTANVYDVDVENAVRISVTPFSTVNGVRYDASSVMLDVNFVSEKLSERTIECSSVEVKPHGTNTSPDANFSTTDVVTYTNDGALELNGLGAKFAFAADFAGGEASVNLTNSKGEVVEKSIFNVYLDGKLTQENITLDFGHHTIVLAEELVGEHEIILEKVTGGDFVCINSFSVCGEIITPPELAEVGAVNVVVNAPANGNAYGDIDVYVRTTEKSGDYYIRYNFDYINNGTNGYTYLTGTSNTHDNTDMYRIVTANLVKKENGSYNTMFDILQGGEVSLAIKERHYCTTEEFEAANKLIEAGEAHNKVTEYTDTSSRNYSAPDFVGGFHGDELYVEDGIKFYLDGVAIDPKTVGNYTGTHFEFEQIAIINRCDEEDEEVMLHDQYILLDTNGLRLEQHIEFLTDDFSPEAGQTYLQMATAYRIDTSLSNTVVGTTKFIKDGEEIDVNLYNRAQLENLLIHTNTVLDANGKVSGSGDMADSKYLYRPDGGYVTAALGYATRSTNRYTEYIGAKGVYGKVGYVIDDYSTFVKNAYIQVRLEQGDNKWYASFYTYNPSDVGAVPKGEIWNVSDYYYFDYNPEVHSVAYEKAE